MLFFLGKNWLFLIVVSLWKQFGDLCWRNNEGFWYGYKNELEVISDKSYRCECDTQVFK